MFALLVPLAQPPQPAPGPTGGGPPPGFEMLPYLFIFVFFFIFMVWLPSRKQKQQQRDMLGKLKKRDKVVTISGIIGTVDGIKDDEITLRIDENSPVRLRIIKSSIDRVLATTEDAGKDKEKEEG